MKKEKKPKPPVLAIKGNSYDGWALYRAGLSCKIGKDAINKGANVEGRSPAEYGVYCLLCAVEDLVKAMIQEDKK
jgi:hypothetical protein